MKENHTLQYYEKNALAFAASTTNVDFSEIQNRFLGYIPAGGEILDFGCGAGRDTKYFLEHGYQVTAIDGSETLCKMAAEYAKIPVRQMLFQELREADRYDGIWACASILHLSKVELADVFQRMYRALKKSGVIYTSFKYGDFEGERNGRYFSDFTEKSFRELLRQIQGLRVEEIWITGDVRAGRGDERWLNILLRRADIDGI